ncbi:MAG: SIMPL domain-containing protein [Acidobacteria bacterium]|nr:SIMPL domain-containing protein [Acidobacteriota bacterium]MCA1642369.1 SIMPL domain-containing protein [Acidobacteriota bacterium]
MIEKSIGSVLLILLTISSSGAQTPAQRPLISVVGEAEMNTSPDRALFTLEVITLDKDLAAAKRANDESVAKTLAAARSHQIAAEDVQTVHFTITPKYLTPAEGKRERVFIGYEITKRILITLKDIGKVDSLIGNVLVSGVNKVVDVSFENSQIRKYREQVREMAITNAQEKARAYARRVGQTIGKAFSITEEGAEGGMYGGGGPGGGGGGDYDSAQVATRTSLVSREVTFSVGKIKVEERVVVSFFLE